MQISKIFLITFFSVLFSSCTLSNNLVSEPSQNSTTNQENPIITNKPENMSQTNTLTLSDPEVLLKIKQGQKIYATINTSLGSMRFELFADKSPKTVANFVGLSEGSQNWKNPTNGLLESGKSLYKGTFFHRIIKGFMIQGGDPLGSGIGGPGYKFADEPVTEKYLRGTLAMANSGPNTNGSQFFIVHQDAQLPPSYTIFGRIDSADSKSLAVLDKIADTKVTQSPSGELSLPTEKVTVESVEIERK